MTSAASFKSELNQMAQQQFEIARKVLVETAAQRVRRERGEGCFLAARTE
jgi:hypothetical protein